MARRKHSRIVIGLAIAGIVLAGLGYAFWPRPQLVDIGTAERGAMRVTIDEEGRTRVHEPYVVSTPITGRLMRVEVEAGDSVTRGDTVVARMRPTVSAALDARTREQARANVTAAEAALRLAQADLHKAQADRDLAQANLERTRKLFDRDIASQAALDASERSARAAEAALDTARASISMRVAQLDNARAQLRSFDETAEQKAGGNGDAQIIDLHAPISGRILRVMQQSETTLPAGTPVLEIGNIAEGLEVQADLLSRDAVRIAPGDAVIIDDWGGPRPLSGTVTRIAPWGFTRTSALGVEEQRVTVTIGFDGPHEDRAALGHGYRVEVRIIEWSDDDALKVPAGALFRDGEGWALFVARDGIAHKTPVEIAANNGVSAAITSGIEDGARIVMYPPAGLTDGARIAPRSAY
ncbi:MAG: HlyD family efflux transporter periplasmic adaptor subunit [Sediminimonas sp.]|uniref:efflux RND transporter periplasmic adaptor subunit n=1 Tax=Sediminimonas sp. TaxID=2823379 RepID=UPI0028704F94|nr:HlyD family efflux transporter periplasmic adaptor subunit [Sediminimonas sp.]MDR9486026.1 HlyD family efflux transporter periplasmic adaptor subunit [Sediminimonas sp.]